MFDPYEDFDGNHDRDNFTVAIADVDCKNPQSMLNIYRPRSGLVYESAKGARPGFFTKDAAAASPGAAGRVADKGARAKGARMRSEKHKGCKVS